MSGRALLVLALAVVFLVAACSQDHSALVRRDRGEAGSGGTVSSTGGAPPTVAGAGGAEAGAGGTLPPEPPGDDVLTLVHGVVDASRVYFCLVRVNGTERHPAPGSPLPEGGLPFGGQISLTALPGLDPATDDFVVTVLAADPAEVAGLSCDAAVDVAQELAEAQPPLEPGPDAPAAGAAGRGGAGASAGGVGGVGAMGGAAGAGGSAGVEEPSPPPIPPPAVRARDLVTVPAGTLTHRRSTLLVARGCLGGGTTLTTDRQEEICGSGYRPARPTLAPVFAALSRITMPDRVGLQVVHAASFASEDDVLTVRHHPDVGETFDVAAGVSPGSVAPPTPRFVSLTALGTDVDSALLEVYWKATSAPTLTQSWGDVRVAQGVDRPVDGQTYGLVVVGPSLRRDPGDGWWNRPTVSIIATSAR